MRVPTQADFAWMGTFLLKIRVGIRKLVGAAGFEPAAPCAQGRCATRLRYAPTRRLSHTPRPMYDRPNALRTPRRTAPPAGDRRGVARRPAQSRRAARSRGILRDARTRPHRVLDP